MANDVLRVILQFDNSQYKREAKEAASATGQIATEAKNTGTATGRMSGQMRQAGTVLKAGFAAVGVKAILDVVGQMDAMNIRAEAVGRRFETVFAEMTNTARDWATEQRAAFGESQTGMESLMAATQDLLVPMGFTRDEALGMTQEILTTANALSEWTGGTRTAAEAQEIATKAILGERDGLVELGVKISEADVQARLAAKGQQGLTGVALEQAKAQATLELIMDKSTDALTAYEDRAGSALATQKDLESQTKDLAETWAKNLEPTINDAKTSVAGLTQFVADLSSVMSSATGEAGSWFDALKILMPGFDGMVQVAGFLGDAMHWVAETLGDADEETKALADSTEQLARDSARGRGRSDEYAAALKGQADAADETADKTGELTSALRSYMTALDEATSPVSAAIGAISRLEEAQANLIAVQGDSSASAEDLAAAHFAVFEAMVEAQGAIDKVDPSALTTAIDGLATALGISEEEARDLLEALGLLDGKTVTTTVIRQFEDRRVLAGVRGAGPDRQHGGAFGRHQMFRAGEQNKPELMIIPGDAGQVFSHVDSRRLINALSRGGSGTMVTNFNVAGNLDPEAVRISHMLAGIQRRIETRRR